MSQDQQTLDIAQPPCGATAPDCASETQDVCVSAPVTNSMLAPSIDAGAAPTDAAPIALEVKVEAAAEPGRAANAEAGSALVVSPSETGSDEPQIEEPQMDEPQMDEPRVLVIGVGGAGGNAVNTMIRKKLAGVEYLAANTDAQALSGSLASARLQLGRDLTRGHGAGGKPDVGRKSAEESADAIRRALEGAHMCFIAAGMGGGTGTGAAPAIASIARGLGVLTVGVVSKPFDFEGPRRRRLAEEGVVALAEAVDTIIVIPNQNLFRVASDKTTFTDAFMMANEVLHQGVKGVTDLMFKPGLVNLDFSDVRAVMGGMGSAMMGSGEAEGAGRAAMAAEQAVDNPLLDDVTLRGAKGVLINITGGPDMTLMDVEAAASRVRQDADPDADIFFGSTIEAEMEGRVRVSVVATGVQRQEERQEARQEERRTSETAAAREAASAANAAASRTTPETPQARAAAKEDFSTAHKPSSDPEPPFNARSEIGGALDDRRRPNAAPRPASEKEPASGAAAAAPEEPPLAGARNLRSDDLVRRITQTMPPKSAGAPIAAGTSDRASAEGAARAAGAERVGDASAAEKPRALGASRPAREGGKFEIPSFLRRQPG